jgi:hypothetical protein
MGGEKTKHCTKNPEREKKDCNKQHIVDKKKRKEKEQYMHVQVPVFTFYN